jgi:predicted CXXCH cytochrome family protein
MVLGFAAAAFAATPTVISNGVDNMVTGSQSAIGASRWAYKDVQDSAQKLEGGYVGMTTTAAVVTQVDDTTVDDNMTSIVTTTTNYVYANPHGGYDTTTNKCKVCHAVHRAEGAYYLLRADSQDDACTYCHIGQSAHSTKVVYDLNPAGIDTTNGHTIGAQAEVPDSTVRQYAQDVTLTGTNADGDPISETIKVRAYDEAKLKMYRFGRHHGQSDEGTGRSGYMKIGPLALRCMSCHQTHNAVDEVWRPLVWNTANWGNDNANVQNLTTFETTGYKLLKRYPSATTTGAINSYGYYDVGRQVKVIEGNAVKEGTSGPWGVETANFSGDYSAKFVYNQNGETAAAPIWIAQDIHEPDAASYPTQGQGYYRYPYFNSKYALSFWCADCHNLNIGGWEPLDDEELGFKAHNERTHPVPFYGAYTGPGQCYSCHRNDLSPVMASTAAGGSGRVSNAAASSCTQCHFGTKDYAVEMGNEDAAGVPGALTDLGLDFPHSGRPSDIKLLGSYTVNVPAGGFTSGNFAGGSPTQVVSATITANNLDAVCLRCHPGVGVHQ